MIQLYSRIWSRQFLIRGAKSLLLLALATVASGSIEANAAKSSSSAFTISSPSNNASVSGSIQITGSAGSKWVNIAAYNSSGSKVANDVAPANGAYALTVDTTKLPKGSNVLSVVAFSVAAGQSGGTSATVSLTVNVTSVAPTPTPTPISSSAFTISSPANNASVSGSIQIKGVAGSEWVNIAAYNSSGSKVANDVAPANGAYALTVNATQLAQGSNALSVMAFSVAAGQSGGTSAQLSLTVNVTGAAATPTPTPTPVPVKPTPTPTPVSTSSSIPFYGVGGHYVMGGVFSTSISQQVADMQAMGMTSIRQDCYNTNDTATMASLVKSFAPIVIQPVFDVYPSSNSSESSAYSQYYAYGQTIAGQLAGKVKIIEMMNEPEVQYLAAGTGNGQSVTDWASANNQWPAFRGAVRGFYDGFRSIDTTKQTLIASPSVGWLHYGILLGLWNGQGPDGSTGNPVARWDVTNYHWYYDFGDIENAGGVNTLSVIKSAFNLPIMLSEVGVQSSVSSSVYNSYENTAIAEYASGANTYNIVGINWYELYNFEANSGFYMGLYSSPGVDNAGRAAGMAAAIKAHPAP